MSSVMLTRLYLHNFKSFWESEFTFDKLNCLIAPNNTGKSNLIEALKFLNNLLYQNSVVALSKVGMDKIKNFHHDEATTKIDADFIVKNRVLVGNELMDYELSLNFFYLFDFETKNPSIDIKIEGKIKSITVDNADLRLGLGDRLMGAFESFLINYAYYDALLDKKNYQSFDFAYNRGTLNYTIESRYEKTKELVIRLFALDIDEKNQSLRKEMNLRYIFNKKTLFSSYYFKADSMKRPEMTGEYRLLEDGKNLPEFLETLDEETFEDISTSLIGEVELVDAIRIEKGVVPQLVFEEAMGETKHHVGLRDISDGTVHFIAIMSAIMGDKEAIGIMIEEPERHMHMKVLSYILDTMRDSDKQIFFTTHSMEILQQLELDEILFMFRDFEGDTKGQRAEDIYNIKKLMKLYKNDLVEMIKIGILGEYEDE